MPIASEQMLKSNIKSGNILNTYFIFGDDTYLKEHYTDKITLSTVDKNDEFNFIKFENGCNLQDVYDAKEQFPILADKKCIIISDYDFEACGKADFEKLLLLLSEPAETAVLIFLCNNLTVDEKKSDRFKKIVSATEQGGGMAVRLNHRTNADLVHLLSDGAVKRGCSFANGAAGYLTECCGFDINILLSELEKLCAYSGTNPITRETIDLICVKSVDASVYNLVKEIINLNITGALELINTLYDMRVEPMIILHTISSDFIDFYRAYTAREAGLSVNTAAEKFGYGNRKFAFEKAGRMLGKFNAEKLRLCLNELVDADRRIKSFSSDGRVILEELTVRLAYIISKGEIIA